MCIEHHGGGGKTRWHVMSFCRVARRAESEPSPKEGASRPEVTSPCCKPFFLSLSPSSSALIQPPTRATCDMLILLPVAGALFSHNALALMIGDRDTPQVVLSNHDSSAATPSSVLEDIDISEGWADPRINGGRFLDVRHSRQYVPKCT